jgi:hypothetical protein
MREKYIRIIKGSAYNSSKSAKGYVKGGAKTIAFDLDETLGSFGDLYLLWTGIDTYIQPDIADELLFRELLDLYPEFLRHGILSILEYLLHKKRLGECSKVVLYTNNQCKDGWVEHILRYLGDKLGEPLFDKTVCAFKIHNKIVNTERTTNNKTYADLIRCVMLPKSAEVCFIDNSYYEQMVHDRVYYIQPRSYEHSLSTDEIIDRFISKWAAFPLPANFESTLYEWFLMNNAIKKGNMNETNTAIDITVSQKIMYYLKEYFLLSTRSPKTKKIAISLGRFTRKKRGRTV